MSPLASLIIYVDSISMPSMGLILVNTPGQDSEDPGSNVEKRGRDVHRVAQDPKKLQPLVHDKPKTEDNVPSMSMGSCGVRRRYRCKGICRLLFSDICPFWIWPGAQGTAATLERQGTDKSMMAAGFCLL